jgi:hypothetical protein
MKSDRPGLWRPYLSAIAVIVAVFAVTPIAQAQSGGFPFIEISMGYGNLSFPNADGSTSRHSGFASQQDVNFTSWFGIDSYIGYYGMGNHTTNFSNVIGAKLGPGNVGRLRPYGVAGMGWSRINLESFGLSGTMLSSRAGGGVDIRMNQNTGFRVDVSRMWFHTGDTGTGSTWKSGMNFSGGILFALQ